MKKWTKIKLVNWHGFYNETIKINGSVVVTGNNGTGKSTFIDAIIFVLTGGEERYFNSAANVSNSRTVETYMRGKTGEEGSPYLRNDSYLVSHIALEFYDEYKKQYFVLGVVLEIFEGSNKAVRNFYHLNNHRLEEKYYVDGDAYLGINEMKKVVGVDLIPLGTNRAQIRKSIHSILEIDDLSNRYYELLPKALAFKPINDINSFVNNFLMPEKNADIDNIKNTINSYNEIRYQLETEEKKQKELNNIVQLGSEYNSLKEEDTYLNYYKVKIEHDKSEEDIKKYKQEIFEKKDKEAKFAEDINLLEKDKERVSESLREVDNGFEREQLHKAENELERAEELLREAESNVNRTNAKINRLDIFAHKVEPYINLARYISHPNYANFIKDVNQLKELLDKRVESIVREDADNSSSYEKKRKQYEQLAEKERSLRKGIHKYDPSVEKLIALIKREFENLYHNEIMVTPLCELIDIEDETYRDAIEGYLGNRRFDLFVFEQHFDFAMNVYQNFKNEFDISNVGIVNGNVGETLLKRRLK